MPEHADAIWHALQIQLRVEPKSWPDALKTIPEEMRPRAEEYLRAQARRMRNVRMWRNEGD